jgi:putative aldouronate transport system permease protein
MTVPFFLLILAFNYGPIWGWMIAFIDYQPGIPFFQGKFVGFKYFSWLFEGGAEFLMVLRNTLVFALLTIVTTPIPVAFALLLTEVKGSWYRKSVQTITSIPNFISWVVAYGIFFALFSVDDGVFNRVLLNLRIISYPLDVLGNPSWTYGFMTLASIWKSAGWSAIIYLAAIAAIDPELYDAARVDGAGRVRQILHITLPGIMPTYSVILILTIANVLNVGFEQYFVFHNALNHEVIEVIDTYTYRLGLARMEFSFATAVGIFKTMVSVLLITMANLAFKRFAGRSIL